MAYRVTIRQANQVVCVENGDSILEAALAAGIDYPFGCRGGVCGSCRSALVSGRVDLRGHQEYALTPNDVRQGFILACCSFPQTDCEVGRLDADEPVDFDCRKIAARVTSVDKVTHDIAVVRVTPHDGEALQFAAGQYASVQFQDLPARCFSFANPPGVSTLEFHVRAVANGQVSQAVYSNLHVGDTALLSGPLGVAYLRQEHVGPAIFCAGGSRLAPILSMLRVLAQARSNRRLHIYFGVRGERDVYALGELNSILARLPQARLSVMLSASRENSAYRTGFLVDAVRTDLDDCAASKAYLCGPPVMIDTCRAALLEKGLLPANCHVDVFWTAPAGPSST